MVDLGRKRPEILAIGLAHARQGHAQQGAPVKAAPEGDLARPIRMAPRNLDRVLDRLSSGGQEDRLAWAAAADELIQTRRERDVRLVGRNLEGDVADLAGLRCHSLDHRGWECPTLRTPMPPTKSR